DEILNLSAFNDIAFGSITTVHGGVLGTTCGVASGSPGLGSLSGSTGAGALPTTISVNGGTYTCRFDGQFCSALDASGCFTHSNTVSATLTGDENEVVSLTPGAFNAGDAYARSRVVAFPRQLLINNSRERVLGLGAGEHNSIDEESRRPGNTGLLALLKVLINLRLVLAARQAGTKLVVIELHLA